MSSRPSGNRALHQMSPLVVAKISSSPSRRPTSRKRAIAPRTTSWRVGARLMSSTSSTKDRAPARAGRRLVAAGSGGTAVAVVSGPSPRSNASNVASACGLPSSSSVKSSAFKPRTGRPLPSTTTASTVTSSTLDAKVGMSRFSCAPATAEPRRAPNSTTRGIVISMTVLPQPLRTPIRSGSTRSRVSPVALSRTRSTSS